MSNGVVAIIVYYERLHTALLAAPGLVLAVWTIRLLFASGKGTLAPWDPPKKLVVFGPHRCVRNPMITGVLLMLAAESVLFGSWPLAAWMVAFLVMHAIYLLRFEEPSLERRVRSGLPALQAPGTALELERPGSFQPIDDMAGGGPFGLWPGQWTDDTSMALSHLAPGTNANVS